MVDEEWQLIISAEKFLTRYRKKKKKVKFEVIELTVGWILLERHFKSQEESMIEIT